MQVVIAPDSFKECLGAPAVAAALARGVQRAVPEAKVTTVPMADGGEGTLAALRAALGARTQSVRTHDALGRERQAEVALVRGGAAAWVESAQACGLEHLAANERDPLTADTYGVGELLQAALAAGAQEVSVSIGGSATVDGGTGLARALGYRFLDAKGQELSPGGAALRSLARIEAPSRRAWEGVRLHVVCDVNNPLLGERGAARVFAPQKGATPEAVAKLEAALAQLAEVVERDLGVRIADLPGAGAAGGMGGGLVAFAGGELLRGVDTIMELLGLPQTVRGADLVLTGEGRTDAQSAGGKVPFGVARVAQQAGVPCVIVAGSVEGSFEAMRAAGITAAFSLCSGPMDLQAALADAEDLLAAAAAQVTAVFAAGTSRGARGGG